jgi:REP element-mobilizing transposase RayT
MRDRPDPTVPRDGMSCTVRSEEGPNPVHRRPDDDRTSTDLAHVEFVDPRLSPFVEPNCRGELPHLYKEGGTYFVTFRQADAVILRAPRASSGQIRLNAEQIAAASEPSVQSGSCALLRPEIAQIVQGAILHFDGVRYGLSAWCIMPNHVHAVFTSHGEYSPAAILHSWKSFSAHQIAKRFGLPMPFWERESFDHLVRNAEDWERFNRYVEENPVAANLCQAPELWPYSSGPRRHSASRANARGGRTPDTLTGC